MIRFAQVARQKQRWSKNREARWCGEIIERWEYTVITDYTFSHKWKTRLHHVGIPNDIYS